MNELKTKKQKKTKKPKKKYKDSMKPKAGSLKK
jgi:hypothetical protein